MTCLKKLFFILDVLVISLATLNCTFKTDENGLKYDPVEDTDKFKSVIGEANRKTHLALGWPETKEQTDSMENLLKQICDSLQREIFNEKMRLTTLAETDAVTSQDSVKLKHLLGDFKLCCERRKTEVPHIGRLLPYILENSSKYFKTRLWYKVAYPSRDESVCPLRLIFLSLMVKPLFVNLGTCCQ